MEKGDFLVVPPHVPHAFAPALGADADVLIVLSAGTARFDYFRLLDRVHKVEASPEEIPASQERFDNHYVDSPIWRRARAAGCAAPDRRALSPLYWSHVNPYGTFRLDMGRLDLDQGPPDDQNG